MPKIAGLTPRWDKNRGRWSLTLPPKYSPSGKRRREYFDQKDKAEARVVEIRRNQETSRLMVQSAGPELIRTAVEFDTLFRDVYGFKGGLREACDQYVRRLDLDQQSPRFGDLIKSYEDAYQAQWSSAYKTKWKWIVSILEPLASRLTVGMGGTFWTDWLAEAEVEKEWGPRTYNDVHAIVRAIWTHAMGKDLATRNPLVGIRRRKSPKSDPKIYTADQVRRILDCAWNHDREMVPFFAIAIFAGLRPDKQSEIATLTWENVSFEERWIRVLSPKTNTKRIVPMEENLYQWLLPWKGRTGPVAPRNLTRRRRWILRGKHTSGANTPEDQWVEVAPSGQDYVDVTRHTYGSFLDAKYRDSEVIKHNMGHTSITTYKQHYQNTRTPKEAEEFWAIFPPEDEPPAIAEAPAPEG